MFLVRHAMPAVDAGVPPEEWHLDPAVAWTLALPPRAFLVSSPEPKARQTLEPAGPVHTDARFGEVTRDEPFHGDYRARRRSYVDGVDHPGWEPRHEVVARFAEGVTVWHHRAGGRPLVVGTHGMAMTVWLTAAVGLTDPGGFWSSLRLPDLLEVDPWGRTWRRIDGVATDTR